MCELSHFSHVFYDPKDCNLPGPSVQEIFQAGILAGVGCHFLLQGIFPNQDVSSRATWEALILCMVCNYFRSVSFDSSDF